MDFLRLNRDWGIVFSVFFAASFAGMIYSCIYLPLRKQSEALVVKVAAAEQELNRNLDVIQQSKKLEEKYKEELSFFTQKISDEGVLSLMIAEVENAAGAGTVSIGNMKPQKVERDDYGSTFPLMLEIDGDVMAVTRFINELQNEPNFFQINSLRINNSSSGHAVLKCRIVLSRTFVD